MLTRPQCKKSFCLLASARRRRRAMIFLTLIVSAINLNDGETNAIEGMTHFVLFATFIMLSLLGL